MLSLVLHVLLGLGWSRLAAMTAAPPPRASTSGPIVLEVFEREAPRVPPRVPAPSTEPPRTRPPRTARAPLAPSASTPPPGSPSPAAPSVAPSVAPRIADVPNAVRLFPGPGGLPVMPEGEKSAGGHTWRPGEGPSAEERLAEERERVRGRVQGFAEDRLAVARVEGGIVDPYFSQMRKALEQQMKDSPLFNYQGVDKELLSSLEGSRTLLKERAQRYGATGTPDESLGGPSGMGLEDVARAGMAGVRARSRSSTALERLEQTAEGNSLEVELELEQDPAGRLLGVKLLRGSGNAAFDQYVLEHVPGALAGLDSASASFATRTRAPTVRSAWSVRGHVSFARTIRLSRLHTLDASDAAYVAGALLAPNIGSSFDETRGEVTIPDVRHPHFDVRTRLLRVY